MDVRETIRTMDSSPPFLPPKFKRKNAPLVRVRLSVRCRSRAPWVDGEIAYHSWLLPFCSRFESESAYDCPPSSTAECQFRNLAMRIRFPRRAPCSGVVQSVEHQILNLQVSGSTPLTRSIALSSNGRMPASDSGDGGSSPSDAAKK